MALRSSDPTVALRRPLVPIVVGLFLSAELCKLAMAVEPCLSEMLGECEGEQGDDVLSQLQVSARSVERVKSLEGGGGSAQAAAAGRPCGSGGDGSAGTVAGKAGNSDCGSAHGSGGEARGLPGAAARGPGQAAAAHDVGLPLGLLGILRHGGSAVQAAAAGYPESLTFWTHQLVPFGSWALMLLACMCVALFLCLSLCQCLEPNGLKAAGLEDQGRVCGFLCGVPVCLCVCVGLYHGLLGRLEFVHIPKNAGTNIEQAGTMFGISWGAKNIGFRGDRRMPDGSFCSGYHTPPSRIAGLTPYSGSELFCVTRHPYDRAVSEYPYMLSHPWGRQYYDLYHNGLYDKPECSPEGLNHYVQTTLRLYLDGKRYIDDCHHVSQVEYIWDSSGAQLCTHIIRAEDLPGAFNKLMKQHGYAVRMSEEKVYSAAELCPDISVDTLTNESRQMLREIYADDFRWLNYSAY